MGEARLKKLNGAHLDTLPATLGHQKRVRVVSQVQIHTVASEQMLMMVVGDRGDALALQMRPEDARTLAETLVKHALEVEQAGSQLIVPAGVMEA